MIDNSWCGWGSCFHPSWMQKFNRPEWYLVAFGLYGWTQCMAGFYFTSTISTIEKRFKLPSKITGIIMSGNDVSIVMLSLTLTYYGSKRNRPMWMGVGGVITAISCFLIALPHFIYGPGKDALALTKEFWDQEFDNLSLSQIKEDTSLCLKGRHREVCTEDDLVGEFSFFLVAILFFSQFVLGIGWTLFQTLGQTYLDDNTDKKKTPFMISIASSLRQLGPALGSYLTSACLKLYIDLSVTPVIDMKDPRWIGAWWLGTERPELRVRYRCGAICGTADQYARKMDVRYRNVNRVCAIVAIPSSNLSVSHLKTSLTILLAMPDVRQRLCENQLRIVLKKDKDFAQGLGLVLYSLLGQIPGPIIFGAVIDSTCLVWDRSCGAKGNCWLYNKDSFRIRFFSVLAAFCLISSLLDMKVWHLGKNVDMYKDYDENKYMRKEVKRLREKNKYMREEDEHMREEAKDMREEDKDMREEDKDMREEAKDMKERMFQKEEN
uniref:Solute carrier organic anion transporter family member n=1 Tax=Timema bartmani TaxID=61472 RepID=A0A7R9EQ88_9NEOP|nr:unnamed protein product [Timema bartmani]